MVFGCEVLLGSVDSVGTVLQGSTRWLGKPGLGGTDGSTVGILGGRWGCGLKEMAVRVDLWAVDDGRSGDDDCLP